MQSGNPGGEASETRTRDRLCGQGETLPGMGVEMHQISQRKHNVKARRERTRPESGGSEILEKCVRPP